MPMVQMLVRSLHTDPTQDAATLKNALLRALNHKDPYTYGHVCRVARYTRMLAQYLGLPAPQQATAVQMALLHDVGKLAIPDELLHKRTALTEAEAAQMRTHAALGGEMLRRLPALAHLAPGANWHHEWYNGTGYPDGLQGGQILLEVRLIAVADAYDAMASARDYQTVLPQATVRAEIAKGRGTQFDPADADAMLAIIDADVHYTLRQN